MIYYDFIRKVSTKECYRNLLEAFGDKAPFKRTIERWFLNSREKEPR